MTRKAYQTILQTTIAACTSAASGDLESVMRLCVQGFDINEGDYDKRTCLHLASAAGHIEIVKYLVGQGCNVSPRDRWGASPLNDAQDPTIIEFLQAHGAEKGIDQSEYHELPQVTVSDDQFRLYYAAYHDDVLLMQTLHILGWKVNAYDYDGRTALGIAASEGHIDSVKYLISHGANPAHKDVRNNDALGDARREGRTEVIEYLEKVLKK
jgi:ankyrin repeat protein